MTAPEWWECDVVLSDGGTVHIRPIKPEDTEALIEFHASLSEETVVLRFFGFIPVLRQDMAERFTCVDHVERVALVAEHGGRLIGVARYDRLPGTADAEVAFVVADGHQGRGLGSVLLEHLAAAARERQISRFVADTLAHNRRMLDVFRSAGFVENMTLDAGVIHVELWIDPTDAVRAVVEAREHRAEAASVARVLSPHSVAVIGASTSSATVGHQVLRNLLAGGFAGPVFPVNLRATQVASIKAYPSILAIPDAVDVAVIAVPAAAVIDVVRQCGEKGVAGLVVLTAGFGEVGPSGAAAQTELREMARRHGMRLVGPNCIGIVNTAIGLDATFSSHSPTPGRIAMQSQSGALGIAVLERSARLGVGVSTFVSVGNKADVSGNDLLQYWEDDPATDVVLLYLESFGNPIKFSRIARRVSRRKPIVAVKSGRSAAGVRAASSHTAAMASPDSAVDALFRQCGVIRVDTLDEMFEAGVLLASQPLPAGRRIAVVSNSGGPGILAVDACDGAGLIVPELAPATQDALRAVVDANAAVGNPVDLVASATPDTYRRALDLVLADDGIDAAVVICTPTFAARPADVGDVLARASAGTDKPIVGCFLAWPEMAAHVSDVDGAAKVPAYPSPEPAVRSLGRAAAYGEWRRRVPGSLPELDGLDLAAALAITDAFLRAHPSGGWIEPGPTADLLGVIGVPVVSALEVTSAPAAADAAARLGGKIALKGSGPDIVHKTDEGAVALDLSGPEAAATSYAAMAGRLGHRMTGAVVQEMAASGVETIVGVVQDPLFGPLVMFGLGGVATELLCDRAFRVLPLTDLDAAELVRSLRSSPLLFGHRGAPACDTAALEDMLQRVARTAGAIPEIAELDLNPVIVSAHGAIAVDARIRLAPHQPGPAPGSRRMP